MSAVRVILLRGAVLLAIGGLSGTSPALGAGGGTVLPGVGLPSEPESTDSHATPGGAATIPAAPLAAAAAPPALAAPPLSAAARRPGDPPATDLAALANPSRIVAVDGHVIVVRNRGAGTELVDLAAPAAPRVLLTSTRRFGTANTGHDAAGHPVVVASPCAGIADVLLGSGQPNCPLRAVDLTDGTTRALAGTTGALSGDLDGDRLVFTRRSPTLGVRLYENGGGRTTSVPLPQLTRPGDGWRATLGTPTLGSLRSAEFDAQDGRLALVLEYSTGAKYVSGLWLRNPVGAWSLTVAIGTGGTSGLGLRHVLGPLLDVGGVRAYVEGVVETPSYLGRWADDGSATTRTSIRRSIGRSTIVSGAAYDGDRLVFVDWRPGAPCGTDGAPACGVRAVGPLTVR